MRLDKYLAEVGLGSRTEVKALLKKGRIWVNDQVEKSPKRQIDRACDEVRLDDRRLHHETFVYYLLNKPAGVISATEDAHYATVLDLLDETAHYKAVFPVGRLDIDTHGLLLLTNNGPLAHAMSSPKKHVDKVYCAQVAGIMDQADAARFADGLVLKDFTCQPAHLEILATDELAQTSVVQIRLSEGKFHQVKRMVAACGKTVTDLQRLSMGPLQLPDDLALGQWRRLTAEELARLAVFGVDL